jgi:hypothetical protein
MCYNKNLAKLSHTESSENAENWNKVGIKQSLTPGGFLRDLRGL